MKRILIAITGGALIQALLLVTLFLAPAAVVNDPNPSGIAVGLKLVVLIAFQLSMPGFLLFVPEHGHSAIVVRVLAILFDVAIYSLVIYLILRVRSAWKTAHNRPIQSN